MNVYESPKLRSVTGPAIRPGGFDLTEKGVSLCRFAPESNVLDAGCGSGATVEYLSSRHRAKVFGLDLSPTLLQEARKRVPHLPLMRADASRAPFRDQAFSVIFCECVLSLVSERGGALAEFFRILRPGGYLIATDIYLRNRRECKPFQSVFAHCCLKGAVSRHRICQSVTEAGFAILAWEDHSDLLKILAAQMVFAYGSLRQFWSSLGLETASEDIASDVKAFRPGYYFLAARRESKNG